MEQPCLICRVVTRKYLQPMKGGGGSGYPGRGHKCCRPRMANRWRSIPTYSLSVGPEVATSLICIALSRCPAETATSFGSWKCSVTARNAIRSELFACAAFTDNQPTAEVESRLLSFEDIFVFHHCSSFEVCK